MAFGKAIAVFTISVSLITFIAFFGRLPAFRNTPIGFSHRLLVLHIPSFLRSLDRRITDGRVTSGSARLGHYLMNEKHPVVMIFFLGLITVSAVLFVPAIWAYLESRHKLFILVLLPLPHIFTYLCAKRNAEAIVTASNHAAQMRHYPYDRILFFPGNTCSTCQFLKPARSKHCSICKSCVARCDHHCIWVNNCLGRGNYKWFLGLLLSTGILIAYGAYLAYIVLTPRVNENYRKWEGWYKYKPRPDANASNWASYFDMKLHYFLTYTSIYIDAGGIRASGVGLLALLTWPLPLGLLGYQMYLMYAGMTTNESSKWADWRDTMANGVVFLGQRKEDTMHDFTHHGVVSALSSSLTNEEEPRTTWPLESRHILLQTTDGQPPANLPSRIASVSDRESFKRVWNLGVVENVYDLGFWDTLVEVIKH